jgi:GrpB-like predicted nucleotidyltransferase (UPF0157 family)
MTPQQAYIYNTAIKHALDKYPKGMGAIRALLIKEGVTVEHIGTTTLQEVYDVES